MENVEDLTDNANVSSVGLGYNCYNVRAFKNDYAEDMVMVNPSLVTGTSVEIRDQNPATSPSVPVNLLLGDGTVLGQIKVKSENGGIDLHTLQNLVSNQLLLAQQTELAGNPSPENTVTGSGLSLITGTSQNGDSEFDALDASVHISADHAIQAAHTTENPTEQQPKKHKGGWPKGKKRKPEKITNAPKPPSNAYRLYTVDRRIQLREKFPDMSFAEQVRKMGAEWSHEVNNDVKKKYFALAEADRKRYVEELNLYQQSDTYQDYLNKKAKAKSGLPVTTDSLKVKEVYDPDILYCNLCDIYFNNNHNKTEHLMGAKHIKNVTKSFEEGIKKAKVKEASDEGDGGGGHPQLSRSPSRQGEDGGPVDVERFVMEFSQRNHDRDQEVQHLRESIEEAQKANSSLAEEFIEYKNLLMAMEQEVATVKTRTSLLTANINSLLLLPNIFGLAKPL